MFRTIDGAVAVVIGLLALGAVRFQVGVQSPPSTVVLEANRKARILLESLLEEVGYEKIIIAARGDGFRDIVELTDSSTALSKIARFAISGRSVINRGGPYAGYASAVVFASGTEVLIEVWVSSVTKR